MKLAHRAAETLQILWNGRSIKVKTSPVNIYFYILPPFLFGTRIHILGGIFLALFGPKKLILISLESHDFTLSNDTKLFWSNETEKIIFEKVNY